jgi:cyclopropane fatty-acyl-phospholipid synthase-like methyltransferase
MSREPPDRLAWAVDALDVQPSDHILEVGCGRGVAAALIAARLTSGRLVAIDRSDSAIAAATERNRAHVEAGTARFCRMAMKDVDPASHGPFDKVLAVNVNLFWVEPAELELRLIADVLRPRGRVQLVYEPPDAARVDGMSAKLLEHLSAAGYESSTGTAQIRGSLLLAVTARPRR